MPAPRALPASTSREQQAVEIAKALRRDVKLLLLDEPTSSLTPHEVRGLFTLLRRLRDRGVAIVFISHRIEEALDLCDRIVVLRDGRLISNTPSTRPIAPASSPTWPGIRCRPAHPVPRAVRTRS